MAQHTASCLATNFSAPGNVANRFLRECAIWLRTYLTAAERGCTKDGAPRGSASEGTIGLGAKDCTPEINTSEIIVDFQWHFPMDFQWCFPTEFRLSMAFPEGLSLAQWIFTGIVLCIFSGVSQWNFTSVISGVIFRPDNWSASSS